jgi:hypothetical protein
MGIVFAVAATAAAVPIAGTYLSDDLDGGTFLTGRASEGYFAGPPDGNEVGNGMNAASWDGSTLGGQWEITDSSVAVSQLVYSSGGFIETVVLQRVFDVTASTLWLHEGPWTEAGDGSYEVDLDFYEQTITTLWEGSQMLYGSSVESFAGTVVGTGQEVTAKATGAYRDQGLSLPSADWPAWQPGAAVAGSWSEVGMIRMDIQPIPEPATMALLAAGGTALLRRRNR